MRDACAYVPQDNFLFSDTISGNISFAFDDENQEAIEDAAMMSDVHDNIAEFKEGYRTVLGERGVTVSGGQKQRAAVARALITDPKLILADEPTGALDSRAASDLLSMFNEVNREGQTILMVTHSAQAASHASRVLFIKDGEVFHQIYRGTKTRQEMYQMIADTLTILTTGGETYA